MSHLSTMSPTTTTIGRGLKAYNLNTFFVIPTYLGTSSTRFYYATLDFVTESEESTSDGISGNAGVRPDVEKAVGNGDTETAVTGRVGEEIKSAPLVKAKLDRFSKRVPAGGCVRY